MRPTSCGGLFDVDKKIDRINALEQETLKTDFWNDAPKAKDCMMELETLKLALGKFDELRQSVDDISVLREFYEADPREENERELNVAIETAKERLSEMQMTKMLSGQLDANNCFVQINAGAGGTESCDWASMLCRMYMRYAERKGYQVGMVDFTEGDGAGYRSVTLEVVGRYAYGHLKAENGVHRLVRCSPFDANNRRHTSFCSVFVYAVVDKNIDIVVKDEDIDFEAMRAGGAGGQKVNKTSSAVRITHKPSGIVVRCQTERSQHQNREQAMKLLKARLYEQEQAKRDVERKKVEEAKEDVAWGSQIRSYVLHPYQMIKDHRTGYETSQSQKVLDGDIDAFVKEYLIRSGAC